MKVHRRQLASGRTAVHQPEKLIYFFFNSRRTGDVQGFSAGALMEKLDEQERQAAEVIAVEMADKNHVQTPRVETCALHGQQGRGSAVQKKRPVAGLDEISALVAAAAAKSIAAAENMQFHGAVPRNRFALDSILEFPRRPILALRRMRRHREVAGG